MQVFKRWIVVKLRNLIRSFETASNKAKVRQLALLKPLSIKQNPDNKMKENYSSFCLRVCFTYCCATNVILNIR